MVNPDEIQYGLPEWSVDLSNWQRDGFLIRLPFKYQEKRGVAIMNTTQCPVDPPELMNEFINQMKADLPGAIERGEVRDMEIEII